MSNALKKIRVINDQQIEVFRQERFTSDDEFAEDIKVIINNNEYPLVDWSRTGIAFSTSDKQVFTENQIVKDIRIQKLEFNLYEGDIEICSVRKDEEKTVCGTKLLSDLFPIEGIPSLKSILDCEKKVQNVKPIFNEVAPEVCKLIFEIRESLEILKQTCDKEEIKLNSMIFETRVKAEKFFLENMAKKAKNTLAFYNRELANMVNVDQLPEGTIFHKMFEDYIYPYFSTANMPKRAKEKPQGYAGDFEMMNQIYRGGFEGTDLIGKVLHNYIANEDSSESVLFRKPYFTNFYRQALKNTDKDVHILSVACGPCSEFQDMTRDFDQADLDRINLTLFDLDRDALEHAQTQIYNQCIKYKKDVNIDFINASVRTFLIHSETNQQQFDLIYSGGLFDYLDNPTSTAIVTNLYELLKPNGTMVIGNFTENNTTKAFCHLLTEWHLLHKTEDEVRNWACNIKDAKVEIEYDDNKINAFIVIKKP